MARREPAAKAVPVTVSVPSNLLAELDRLVEEAGFTGGRSGAVQAALMAYVAEQKPAKGGREQAVLAVCFNKLDERRVGAVKHDYSDIIRSMLHAHLQGNDCVEVYVVDGPSARVSGLFSGLSALRGIHLVRRTTIPGHAGLL